jgi:hypothetical protein
MVAVECPATSSNFLIQRTNSQTPRPRGPDWDWGLATLREEASSKKAPGQSPVPVPVFLTAWWQRPGSIVCDRSVDPRPQSPQLPDDARPLPAALSAVHNQARSRSARPPDAVHRSRPRVGRIGPVDRRDASLTLTGAGGSGKTRPCEVAATESGSRTPESLSTSRPSRTRRPSPAKSRPHPIPDRGGRPAEALIATIADSAMLLVLDNCGIWWMPLPSR